MTTQAFDAIFNQKVDNFSNWGPASYTALKRILSAEDDTTQADIDFCERGWDFINNYSWEELAPADKFEIAKKALTTSGESAEVCERDITLFIRQVTRATRTLRRNMITYTGKETPINQFQSALDELTISEPRASFGYLDNDDQEA